MPLRFTLRQLEYLVAVGETGSIARAAERLHVSSPSISAAIAQLEAELALPLFARRHAHGLVLTQAGRRVLDQARAVLAEAARLNALTGEIAGQVGGPLSVGCLLTFAQILLPHIRRGFVARYPAIRFAQHERDQQAIFEGLRDGALDVALTYDLDLPPDLLFTPLFDLPPYALLPETHPLAGRRSLSPADLAPHPMVLLDLPHSAPYFLSLFAQAGVSPQVAERTRDMEVMKTLVANGFGYSIANIRHASDRAADGKRLRFIPLSGEARPMRMGWLATEAASQGLSVRALIAHCRESLSPALPPGLAPFHASDDR